MSATSGLASAYLNQTSTDANASVKKTEQDKEMFLKLLVTQLSHQDPLNPVEDKEFISQLAQFTSLEELQKINSNIDNVVAQSERGQLMNAVGFVGKAIVASGSDVAKIGDSVTPIYFTNDQVMTTCNVTVVNKETGMVIYAESLGTQAVGEHPFQWNGKTYSGSNAADGVYEILVSGTNAEGSAVLATTEMLGAVIGVEMEGGVQYLRLSDGRKVPYTSVNIITNVSGGSGSGTADSGSGEATEGG